MSRFGEHRGFGRGRPRDERTRETGRFGSTSSTLFVPSQDCGKIIGKGGSKIRELQETTQARIKVSRDDEGDGTRMVEISGAEAAVEEARQLIENLVGLWDNSDDHRHPGGATDSFGDHRYPVGSRDNFDAHTYGYPTGARDNFDGHNPGQSWNTHTSSDDDWEEDLNKTNCNNANSQVQNDDDDDGWNDTPTHGTWTSSSRGTGSRGRGGCHKCGRDSHFSRDCPSSGSQGPRSGGCHKCGEEGHFARDCTQSSGGGSARSGTCHKCGEAGHFARDCPQQSSKNGFGSGFGSGRGTSGSNSSNWRQEPKEEEGPSDVILVSSNDVGRIIGRGGSKIRELQEDSDCKIKVARDEGEFGEVEVTLTGPREAIQKAKKLIFKCGVTFSGGTDDTVEENAEAEKPRKIDWAYLRANKEELERQRFADCAPIEKEFYIEEDHVRNMHPEDVRQFRLENNNIMVDNPDCPEISIPNPVLTFEDGFKHYPLILEQIKKQGFTRPSPIQSQAWPILLSGRDLIGIAQTGTGKTLAFLLPALVHIDGQPVPRSERTGPTCLVLCPTRELALQIQEETKKINYKGIKSVCVYGGGNRREQVMTVKKGVEIIVATPGRLNDLIDSEIIDVKSVTYLVLDEADRMLDMGFEPDIRKVLLDIRPDRQTVMTSATWPIDVQRLADRYMNKPLHVHVGTLDLAAVHSVKQEVVFMTDEEKKDYLFDFLANMQPDEKVLVFVGKKIRADDISSDLALQNVMCQCIHGDREQCDRIQALEEFKSGFVRILIATDVASRGLDVKDITHVLNYDFPRNIEEYVHRVGRTGRAGRSGVAITFLTRGDWRSAQQLINIMSEANQEVPEELIEMAERFRVRQERDEREGRQGGGRGGGRGFGGGRGGRGFGGGGGGGGGGRFRGGGGRFGGRERDDFDGFMF